MIRRLDELAELEGEDAGKELHQEGGTIRVSNLVNKGPMFEIGFSHPRVLAAIRHVIGPRFKLSSLDCRMALPGTRSPRVSRGLAFRSGTGRLLRLQFHVVTGRLHGGERRDTSCTGLSSEW